MDRDSPKPSLIGKSLRTKQRFWRQPECLPMALPQRLGILLNLHRRKTTFRSCWCHRRTTHHLFLQVRFHKNILTRVIQSKTIWFLSFKILKTVSIDIFLCNSLKYWIVLLSKIIQASKYYKQKSLFLNPKSYNYCVSVEIYVDTGIRAKHTINSISMKGNYGNS